MQQIVRDRTSNDLRVSGPAARGNRYPARILLVQLGDSARFNEPSFRSICMDSVGSDHLSVPTPTLFDRALLGCIGNIRDSETSGIAAHSKVSIDD